MNFVDTHCHLYLEGFQDDLEEVLGRAAAANVRDIFLPAIDWHSLQQMDTLTRAASQLHEASQQPDESRQPVETLPYTESQLNAESHAQSPIRFWKPSKQPDSIWCCTMTNTTHSITSSIC